VRSKLTEVELRKMEKERNPPKEKKKWDGKRKEKGLKEEKKRLDYTLFDILKASEPKKT
jgi:hypothetical protein